VIIILYLWEKGKVAIVLVVFTFNDHVVLMLYLLKKLHLVICILSVNFHSVLIVYKQQLNNSMFTLNWYIFVSYILKRLYMVLFSHMTSSQSVVRWQQFNLLNNGQSGSLYQSVPWQSYIPHVWGNHCAIHTVYSMQNHVIWHSLGQSCYQDQRTRTTLAQSRLIKTLKIVEDHSQLDLLCLSV